MKKDKHCIHEHTTNRGMRLGSGEYECIRCGEWFVPYKPHPVKVAHDKKSQDTLEEWEARKLAGEKPFDTPEDNVEEWEKILENLYVAVKTQTAKEIVERIKKVPVVFDEVPSLLKRDIDKELAQIEKDYIDEENTT